MTIRIWQGVLLGSIMAAAAHAEPAALCVGAETLIADMGTNDVRPAGVNPTYGWSKAASVNTAIATYDRQPDWWKADNAPYAGAWPNILPWFVIFNAEGSPDAQADIQIGRMAIRYLSKSDGKWHLLDKSPTWEVSMCDAGGNYVDCRMEPTRAGEGGFQTFRSGGTAGNGHGWFEKVRFPDAYDVKSLTVSVEIRTVGAVTPGQMAAHVGADFYPEQGHYPGANPGAGASKVKRIGSDWTVVSMTVLKELSGNDTGVSAIELRANPPCVG